MRGGKARDLGAAGIPIGQGPGLPGVVRRILAAKMLEQGVEQRLPLEARAPLAPELLERRLPRAWRLCPERLEQKCQGLELERRDGRIVDQPRAARPLQAGLESGAREQRLRRLALRQLRHLLDRDHKDVEEAPAGGRVGAVAIGRRRQLGVDRIDADKGGAEAAADVGQLAKIGEIADPPARLGAQAIERRGHAPEPVSRADVGDPKRPSWRYDQACARCPVGQLEPVVAERQPRKRQAVAPVPGADSDGALDR
jgi:hypothetical protein